MKTPTIGSRVEFIRQGTRCQGMVFDRRPHEPEPLYVVVLGYPGVFNLRDDEVIVLKRQFCAPATTPA